MGADANLRFIYFFYLSPFLSGIFERAITRFARDFRACASGITHSVIPERKDGLLVVHFFFIIKSLRSITTLLLNGIIVSRGGLVRKAGELQRASLLFVFLC